MTQNQKGIFGQEAQHLKILTLRIYFISFQVFDVHSTQSQVV